jgi:hypothetical protein
LTARCEGGGAEDNGRRREGRAAGEARAGKKEKAAKGTREKGEGRREKGEGRREKGGGGEKRTRCSGGGGAAEGKVRR